MLPQQLAEYERERDNLQAELGLLERRLTELEDHHAAKEQELTSRWGLKFSPFLSVCLWSTSTHPLILFFFYSPRSCYPFYVKGKFLSSPSLAPSTLGCYSCVLLSIILSLFDSLEESRANERKLNDEKKNLENYLNNANQQISDLKVSFQKQFAMAEYWLLSSSLLVGVYFLLEM